MAWLRRLGAFDAWLAGGALALMLLIPLVEIVLRPLSGRGIENALVLVQHPGLVLAMFGALVAPAVRPGRRRGQSGSARRGDDRLMGRAGDQRPGAVVS